MRQILFICVVLCIQSCFCSTLTRQKRAGTKACTDGNDNGERVVCYYGSWAKFRPGDGKFKVEDLDASLCTHVIYSFAFVKDNKLVTSDPGDEENYKKFVAEVRRQNPDAKAMLAVGGWTLGSTEFSNMALNKENRAEFVDSVNEMLKTYDFDGLDLDWEYPGKREGSRPQDKDNFIDLIKELKSELGPQGKLLSAAIGIGSDTVEKAYKVGPMSEHLDFINAMSYDLHGHWEGKTGHHTDKENVKSLIQNIINKGADPKKINLGFGAYGRTFKTQNPSQGKLGEDAIKNQGTQGDYTGEAGFLGYNEICEMVNDGRLNEGENGDNPTAFKGQDFVGYDNVESVKAKSDMAKDLGLGGGMIWSVDTDDSKNKCGEGKYPFVNAVKDSWIDGKCLSPSDDVEIETPVNVSIEPETPEGEDESPADESCSFGVDKDPNNKHGYRVCLWGSWTKMSCGTLCWKGYYCGWC